MKQEKLKYMMPQMEVVFVSENNIYTDIIGASGNAPTMDQTPGSDYNDMFNNLSW